LPDDVQVTTSPDSQLCVAVANLIQGVLRETFPEFFDFAALRFLSLNEGGSQ